MNPAGIVIAIAGVWIVSQVFAGNLLERLNILTPTEEGRGSVIPPIGPGLTPNLPGGPNNPAVPTFPDIFGNAFSVRYL